ARALGQLALGELLHGGALLGRVGDHASKAGVREVGLDGAGAGVLHRAAAGREAQHDEHDGRVATHARLEHGPPPGVKPGFPGERTRLGCSRMRPESHERAALLSFFLPLTRRTCAELRIGDDVIAGYLADVLVEFARADRLWRLRDAEGRPVTTVVEMLGLGPGAPGTEGERDFLRYVGDFALFMSGLFRPWAGPGPFLP